MTTILNSGDLEFLNMFTSIYNYLFVCLFFVCLRQGVIKQFSLAMNSLCSLSGLELTVILLPQPLSAWITGITNMPCYVVTFKSSIILCIFSASTFLYLIYKKHIFQVISVIIMSYFCDYTRFHLRVYHNNLKIENSVFLGLLL